MAVCRGVYIIFAFCCQLGLNLVTDIPSTLLFLGASSVFVAPFVPYRTVLLVSRLPPRAHMVVIALGISIGQVRAAFAPLAVGFIESWLGFRHLFETVYGLMSLMLMVWMI